MGKIVILTGAGISAESGLSTFRDQGGIWAQHRIEDVATPGAFARNPLLVHDFYNTRRVQAAAAEPNDAHRALAWLEAGHEDEVVIVTQNVDDLHTRAGSRNVLQMHGKLAGALCGACDRRWDAPMRMDCETACPFCGARRARPDVVWFGEYPYFLDEIAALLRQATVFAAIGTSGQVYPAAGFVEDAISADTVEFGLEETEISRLFSEHYYGPATETVPRWVDLILGDRSR